MAGAIGVRRDYSAADLRGLARGCIDGEQVRRLLALALILDGGSRSDAAKTGGVTLQIVRDWVIRFNAEGPEGLKSRKAPGKPSILNDEQRSALAARADPGGALAADRPGAVDMGRVRPVDLQAIVEPRDALARLS